ncbi:MAG: hypothetical protein IJ532_01840 [Alphaproteobacteria bacterium]|nr:hypothetical protein [Alphaproteobacteria bacterium]
MAAKYLATPMALFCSGGTKWILHPFVTLRVQNDEKEEATLLFIVILSRIGGEVSGNADGVVLFRRNEMDSSPIRYTQGSE